MHTNLLFLRKINSKVAARVLAIFCLSLHIQFTTEILIRIKVQVPLHNRFVDHLQLKTNECPLRGIPISCKNQ